MPNIKIGANTYNNVKKLNIPLSDGSGFASFEQGFENVIEYSQMNQVVGDFINNVVYDKNDYSTTEVENYNAISTEYKKTFPTACNITLDMNGTLVLVDENTKGSLCIEKTSEQMELYNIQPNGVGYFLLRNGETISYGGIIKPLGQLRMIHIPNVYNVRDLGGWSCDGGTIKYGLLFRGREPDADNWGQYYKLSEESRLVLKDLLKIGYQVDLRGNSEIDGNDGIYGTEDDVISSAIGENVKYERFLCLAYKDGIHLDYPNTAVTKSVLENIMKSVTLGIPVYIHCVSGADRTGTICMLLEALLGVSQSDIDKDYEITTFGGETRTRNSSNWIGLIEYLNTFDGNTISEKVLNWAIQLGINVDLIIKFRESMIDGIPTNISVTIPSATISSTLTNVTTDNNAETSLYYQPYTAELSPEDGYVIKKVSVSMDGIDITKSVWKGEKTDLYRSIKAVLNKANLGNSIRTITDGQFYATTVEADYGYEITKVIIMMGGIDVSNYYSKGVIAIPKVTGNIVITVETESQAMVDLLDTIGYTDGVRVSTSSDVTKAAEGVTTFGLINFADLEIGDVVRIYTPYTPLPTSQDLGFAYQMYLNGTYKEGDYMYEGHYVLYGTATITFSGNIITITKNSNGNFDNVRFCVRSGETTANGSACIVTINQPIEV